jgi:hypothetical protein
MRFLSPLRSVRNDKKVFPDILLVCIRMGTGRIAPRFRGFVAVHDEQPPGCPGLAAGLHGGFDWGPEAANSLDLNHTVLPKGKDYAR